MAEEEKKSENAATPKEDPSPTVSHHEPAGAEKLQGAAPADPEHSDSHDHASAHDDHAHGHDDHGHATPGVDFGEIIPEKHWQDSLLAGVAVLVLCGFLAVGMIWSKIEPPKEAAAEAAHEAK